MDRTALVTGAGRGLGLELCRQLLESNYTVVACPRTPGSEGLAELANRHRGRLSEIPMDVGDEDSIRHAVGEVAGRVDHLDLLFNNAGIYPKTDGGVEEFAAESLVDAYRVNAVGPLLVVRHLLPLLRRGEGRRIANITSLMGSLADNGSGGSYAYRMSKVALNMAVRNIAHELGPEGFVCLTLHPGWVRTRMGGPGAPLALDDAARQILRTTSNAGAADNGTFKGPGGKNLAW